MMMTSSIELALAFDDVLLAPRYSDIPSRWDSSIDLSTEISPYLKLRLPVISSPMDTITGPTMAIEMWKVGALGVVHRYNTIEKQCEMAKEILDAGCVAGFAIGATGDYLERAKILYSNFGVDVFCIDVAHGNSRVAINAVAELRKALPKATIIAGNVSDHDGAYSIANAGADSIRIGIGSGSLCSTRIVSGSGVPTLTSLLDCKNRGYRSLIADGGIKNSGDAVKALAAGATSIMIGSLIAGTHETPGELVDSRGNTRNKWVTDIDGGTSSWRYKKYRGMASKWAVAEWRPEAKDKIVPEGEETLVEYKGMVKDVLFQLEGGIRSGMTYSGARTVKELQSKAKFIRITSAGHIESQPHLKID